MYSIKLSYAYIYLSRILLTSTSEVYGDPLVHPQPESYWGNVNPIGKCSSHSKPKVCCILIDLRRLSLLIYSNYRYNLCANIFGKK